ncbi:DUF2325 domain-containing protein [Comamonas flocculans]|uniref:DUF2325 domain-containing protein n=1 Tax=Comamonas flocculans TaxID=2597701 RepID=A0A5B8RWD3_9BURK|nr:DUF2325 domain-containing protein [Comamonas flocculans]QEA12545.1 DUF2325 domain-containing protein [Comamonas flocculans]
MNLLQQSTPTTLPGWTGTLGLFTRAPGASATAERGTPATEDRVAPDRSSRRKRLWELDSHAHCPVLGVCMPLPLLRKVLGKALDRQALEDDYDLHCLAVSECKSRSAVAQTLQRTLDQRYRLALQQAARLKTTQALAAWWERALRSQDIAGPFWATLTHARCSAELAHRMEGQVHMLQHQVGTATRVEHDRLEALQERVAELARELDASALRAQRQAQEHARRTEALEAANAQLRAQLLARDAQAHALQQLQAAAAGLQARVELAREVQQLSEQRGELQRALLQARQEAERWRRRADELGEALQRRQACTAAEGATGGNGSGATCPLAERLAACAVLCVGGRQASVPVYRQLIEQTGGRFLHHDGGEEHNPAKLDATLAAADLVICQTGCISHDAYWRVKDHCKRTGKRCIFVDSPSGSGMKKALMALLPAPAATPA